ncbi:MAG: glycosyltransferase family 2 protein [Mangrovibacterium sp.]
MNSTFEWVSASLFCDQENWNKLLKDGINSLVKELKDIEACKFQIYFNRTNGSNIRFSLLTMQEQAGYLRERMDQHFENFFQSIHKKELKLSDEDIFMPFPSNSVQYGLYDLYYNQELNAIYSFQEQYSRIIIDGLSEEIIDDEAIITFAFYLHVALIKTLMNYYKGNVNELILFYQTEDSYFWDSKLTRQYLLDNKEVLFDIVQDIEDNWKDAENMDLDWVKRWIKICNIQIQEQIVENVISAQETNDKIRKIQRELVFVVNKQLGISGNLEKVLFYLLSQILFHHFNSNYKSFRSSNIENYQRKMHIKNVKRTALLYLKMDKEDIPEVENEIRLMVIAKNESLRLPYFLNYYSQLGVDRFFLIDNNSDDDTREIALSYKNVHVFKIDDNYRNHLYWREFFLDKYCKNTWCVVVDMDELFHYPFSEIISLKELILYLETKGYTAVRSLLLDMYSEKPIVATNYKQGDNPIDVCAYFDIDYFTKTSPFLDKKKWEYFNSLMYYGGVRSRIFSRNKFCLTKISLLKYTKKTYLTKGMHAINGANIADIEGTVLHTKFLYDFKEKVRKACINEEYADDSYEYKLYNYLLLRNKNLTLRDEKSVRFKDTMQLTNLGIMKDSPDYRIFFHSYLS